MWKRRMRALRPGPAFVDQRANGCDRRRPFSTLLRGVSAREADQQVHRCIFSAECFRLRFCDNQNRSIREVRRRVAKNSKGVFRQQIPHSAWLPVLNERGIPVRTARRFNCLRQDYLEKRQFVAFGRALAALTDREAVYSAGHFKLKPFPEPG